MSPERVIVHHLDGSFQEFDQLCHSYMSEMMKPDPQSQGATLIRVIELINIC